MNSVTVEPATRDDLESMYRISVLAHQASYDELIPIEYKQEFNVRYSFTDESKRRYESTTLVYIEQPDHQAFVAKIEGQVVGYVTLRRQDGELQLKSLFVHPEYQGKGVGSVLFKEAIGTGNNDIVTLTVIEANDRARHLYEKYGFRVVGKSPALFFGASQVIMKRSGLDGSSR